VITSATGAALQDVLHVLQRRYPAASVIIYPTAVQGAQAAQQIATAINKADKRAECDVILLVRGGGSLEDLWSFNEESVAYAMHRCSLPIISGVGHETDFTIADWVADLRAPTPSAAAELATPDIREERGHLSGLTLLLAQTMKKQISLHKQTTKNLETRLLSQHPKKRLEQKVQRVDELENRLQRALTRQLDQQKTQHSYLQQRLRHSSPQTQIRSLSSKLCQTQLDLVNYQENSLLAEKQRLRLFASALDNVSPLATLSRGYAVVQNSKKKTISSFAQVRLGDKLTTILSDGKLHCHVEKIDPIKKNIDT
jgi:exodeoxyribonuclease VII large subunit